MKPIRFTLFITLAAVLAGNGGNLLGQGTAFTFQGRLNDNGDAASGTYNMRFTLYGSAAGNDVVAGPLTNSATSVSNGLFNVALDFGAAVFSGANRWLEVGVATNDGGAFTTMTPRQQISSTPYAVQSRNATLAAGVSGSVSAGQLTGTISAANIANGTITSAMLTSNAVARLSAPDGSPTNAVQVNTNGLVGIGTTSPQAGLEIVSGSTFVSPQVLFQQQDESGGYTNLAGPIAVAAFGNLLAVAARGDGGITLLDISNPRFPNLRSQFRDRDGTFTNLGGATGVAMKTNLLVVAAETDDAVTLISVTNPASPVKLAELRDGVGGWNELGGAWSVAISGNLLAIAAYGDSAVTLADISNPSAPIKRAEMKDGIFGFTNLSGAASVALSGNLLAIGSAEENSVTLVDVSDPANPVKRAELRSGVGGFDSLSVIYGVALSGGLLAIAAYSDSAVTLVSVTNPANPVKLTEWRYGVGGVDSLVGTRAVAFSGNWLAASGYEDSSVTLFDVSNLSAPRLAAVMRNGVAGFNFLDQALGLTFAGTNLAVAGANDFYGGITLAGLPTATVGLMSQNRVGIGTALPVAPLHVMGNVVVQGADLFDINARRVELGFLTTASGFDSTAMGSRSTASGNDSTAMGYSTTASGDTSTAMGRGTTASGYFSTAMGASTTASGDSSTAMGFGTTASGEYSFAAGLRARATNDGSFVWADSQGPNFFSTGDNQFLIRAAAGMGVNVAQPRGELHVGISSNAAPISLASQTIIIDNAAENGRAAFLALAGPGGSTATNRVEVQVEAAENQRVGIIGTTSNHELQFRQNNMTRMRLATNGSIGINLSNPTEQLHVSGNILASGTITPNSDRNAKTDVKPVDASAILERVAKLSIQQWRFKVESEQVKHIGPMAQDFRAAFGLGAHETAIATVDADGVALAAIQGLNAKLEVELKAKDARIADLERRLAGIERLLATGPAK